ncbi:hypothetical protein IE81DRAFT_325055 [Ceraceosorus guamensis]|uniref:Mini-chromosome maintenance complex-binding protein n=1 Tax=Ceraceosorus guamensis TaxID=1522189 RepID=A0A316VTN8_9BASI|nr:hypothetical protein IE81DRAFT_325055 [Ceraceosorus guamensis]PWN40966.1 hypothetical protein IE81DRAFT_325055 [Ceraceosorus guamensis]
MVPETPYMTLLQSPSTAVAELSPQHADTEELARALSEKYGTLLPDSAARARVPTLDDALSSPQARSEHRGKLLRWRCMVQDTSCGNEVVMREVKGADGQKRCTLWGNDEHETSDEDPDPTTLTERTVLYAITPPAWSAWARDAWQSGSEPSDDVLSTMSGLSLDPDPRQYGALSRNPSDKPAYLSKHSLAEAPGLGALLKIYDHELAETLKVTDVIDVLGVLDFSLLPGADWSQGGAASSSSSAQLPALHVLHITPIAHNDEVPRPLTGASSRDDLVHYLASALGGDLLAAEWTLLGLLARIHSRRGSLTLGALSLNLSGAPAPKLFDVLTSLVPAVMLQKMSLDHLNDPATRMAPASDGSEAGLLAGRLQLPDGTIVLCDESSMGEGTLKDRGVANVRELANLLSTRKLSYAFPFSSFDFETDLPFIVLSAGKSMLPVDVQVPLRSKNIVAAQAVQPTSSQLASWRTFLARARHVDLSIPESVAEQIQAEFVQARKEGQEGVREGQEDLLRRMAVARLVAISRGQRELSFDAWKQAVALDEERRSRVKQSSPATAASAANASSTASVLGGPALG